MRANEFLFEKWSDKYKRSIDCSNPKGFSQRAHCQGRKKNESVNESRVPGEYVYHASYLPNKKTGLRSLISRGLQPSSTGYAGPGTYFAYDPAGGYYHVDKEDATLLRVRWADLVKLYGVYPQNPNGIERDEDEIIVPGPVPGNLIEVEYFEDEWWDLQSALNAETYHPE